MNNKCTLCPRKCNATRTLQEGKGFCKMGSNPVVARISKHMWEEPCISGEKGSGTIFFSGCVMKCVFCQNYKISTENFGKELTPKQLAECYKRLEEMEVNNINLVSGTHFIPAIIESFNIYKPNIPVVYNCGGYEMVGSIKALQGYVDIYLPDFKYATSEIAQKYSNAPNYPEVALSALQEMLRQQPQNIYNQNGIMEKGVIVRHLVLPSNTKNSIGVLNLLNDNIGNNITISLMAQYTPCGIADKYPEINRKITKREYNKVLNHLVELGFDGFTQQLESATTDYIPSFDLRGLE